MVEDTQESEHQLAAIDAGLEDWKDVAESGEWPLLLTGNGASLAVWSGFNYRSLYDKARLSAADASVFEQVGTNNFELVLEALRQASLVCEVLGHDPDDARDTYLRVRGALIHAVREVHVSWAEIPAKTAKKIEKTLASHEVTFTTNYDLINYWAIMSRALGPRVKDLFWGPGATFDVTDSSLNAGSSAILFLHGGLHLFRDARTGGAGKWTGSGAGLLSLASRLGTSTRKQPLFVSEATSADKLRSIRRSDYLSFAYERLATDHRPLVIFGHSLSDVDQHIVDAINAAPSSRPVAVSIRDRGDDLGVIEEKVRINKKLETRRLRFFRSSTHPLGGADLRVP